MAIFLIVSLVIIFIILLLSLTTTSKAYQYKHTIDPVDHHTAVNDINNQENDNKQE
ncbi:YtzI protein [Metabacillus sediminilitoris]|uniref:YtzI protein n=1 Tax=Metabacillus sediminilitoris TaxID=2567941 RepID=A0A4S4BSY6_9BACI|nr:YtzI protein [Metabacillus sediminilitoris]QGQ45531.1 YtzI protein [Metabacillus sediminilitoris]THF77612.1 YtzI protein [Metabacillus sediminilitoris]